MKEYLESFSDELEKIAFGGLLARTAAGAAGGAGLGALAGGEGNRLKGALIGGLSGGALAGMGPSAVRHLRGKGSLAKKVPATSPKPVVTSAPKSAPTPAPAKSPKEMLGISNEPVAKPLTRAPGELSAAQKAELAEISKGTHHRTAEALKSGRFYEDIGAGVRRNYSAPGSPII
jgi:hypothetical protein